MRTMLRKGMGSLGLIDEHDLDIVKLTDDPAEAVDWIRAGMGPVTGGG
jgi:hypothetical protein